MNNFIYKPLLINKVSDVEFHDMIQTLLFVNDNLTNVNYEQWIIAVKENDASPLKID